MLGLFCFLLLVAASALFADVRFVASSLGPKNEKEVAGGASSPCLSFACAPSRTGGGLKIPLQSNEVQTLRLFVGRTFLTAGLQIGRASCRERVSEWVAVGVFTRKVHQ